MVFHKRGSRPNRGRGIGVGLLAACVGVARLALLGWLLAKVLAGDPMDQLVWPFVGVALVMLARDSLEHIQSLVTALLVVATLRMMRGVVG